MLSLSNQTSSLAPLLASTVVKFAACDLSNWGLLMSDVVRHEILTMPVSSIPNVPAVETRMSSANEPAMNGPADTSLIAPICSGRYFENGMTQSGNWRNEPGSFPLDVSRFDDRPPLLGLRFLVGVERLRRLQIARRDLLAEVDEFLLEARVCQRSHDGRIQLRNDVFWCALGSPHPMPNRQVKSRHASLIHGRNVRRQRKPFRCGDRERLDLAIAQLLKGIPRLIEHEINLPCDQILHRGRCPSIGHELNVRAGTTLEVRAKQPTPGRKHSGRRLVRVGFQPGYQFLQVFCRQCKLRIDKGGSVSKTRDRFEIVEQVVRK